MKYFWLVNIGIVLFISLNWQPSQLRAEDDCPMPTVVVTPSDAKDVISGKATGSGCDAILEVQNKRAYWVNMTMSPVGNGLKVTPMGYRDQDLYNYRLIPPNGTITFSAKFTYPGQTVTVAVDVTSATSDAARQANLSQALLDILKLVGAIDVNTEWEIQFITEYYPELKNSLVHSPHLLAALSSLIASDSSQFFAEMDLARQNGEINAFLDILKGMGVNFVGGYMEELVGGKYLDALRTIWKSYSTVFKLLTGSPADFVVFTAGGESPNLTFIPTPTVTLTKSEIPNIYRVAFVADNDTLNVRSGAGANYKVVGTLAHNATRVEITGAEEKVGNSIWVPIQHDGMNGWVNRYYLTQEVDGNTFCSQLDSRNLVNQLTQAFQSRDGNLLQGIAGPLRGLLIRINWWNKEVRILPNDVERFFDDKTIRDWGSEDGSGLAISGSLTQIILPLIDKDFFSNPQFKCNQIIGGGTAGLLQLPPEYEAVNFYSIYSPPPDNEDHYADWGTWVVGIEYWDGKPVICYLIHYEWEI